MALCGVCAFLELYCTQPLLPLLAHIFHASKTGVGMTVSAATLGVAISAPIFGAITERLPRKRVIVISLLGVSIPTLLAATSTSLAQLIFWRFLQGIMVPGIIAVVVTYIGEEWPPERVALIMSFYVSGTALGGFMGRISAGILADCYSWRVSFVALGAASLVGAAAVAAWLPHGRRRAPALHQPIPLPAFPYQVQEMFRNRRLVATFAVGFNVLFSLVGVFTWITFYLSAAPFLLSTTALSSLFFVYLIGLIVTPARRLPHHARRPARRHWRSHLLLHRRRPADACALAARGHPRTHHAFERCLYRANCLAKPSPRRRAARRPGHRCRNLHHLLLPRRHRRRRRSREPSGPSANGPPASRSSSPCRLIALSIALVGWRTPIIEQTAASARNPPKCRIVQHSQQSMNPGGKQCESIVE